MKNLKWSYSFVKKGAVALAACFALNMAVAKDWNSASALSNTSTSMLAVDASSQAKAKNITNVKVFHNPIANQISVAFKLAQNSEVNIRIMDALGSEVMNLMQGSLEEGVQNLLFDLNSNLSEGFYFVRITSGTEVIIKRVSIRKTSENQSF